MLLADKHTDTSILLLPTVINDFTVQHVDVERVIVSVVPMSRMLEVLASTILPQDTALKPPLS